MDTLTASLRPEPYIPRPVVAQVALCLLSGASRKALAAAPRPSDDQAIALACKMIDLGIECDEDDIYRALGLLKSRVTIEYMRAVA